MGGGGLWFYAQPPINHCSDHETGLFEAADARRAARERHWRPWGGSSSGTGSPLYRTPLPTTAAADLSGERPFPHFLRPCFDWDLPLCCVFLSR
jgi:hypothetical protein